MMKMTATQAHNRADVQAQTHVHAAHAEASAARKAYVMRGPEGQQKRDNVGDGETRSVLPHVDEFVAVAREYLSEDTIVITGVRDTNAGVVDVVFVGAESTVGFIFGQSTSGPMPSFADAAYYLDALDVAHGLPDVLYVVARNHASLFRPDVRLSLVPHCSSRILATPARPRSSYVGQGDDGQPIVIRERVRVRRGDVGFAA